MSSYHGPHAEKQLVIFNQAWATAEYLTLIQAFQNLCSSIRHFPKNPKFLAIFYVEGVFYQLRELTFAVSGMKADAEIRKAMSPPEPSEQLFLINFFGGDALYRLMSIKDKLLAGFYCSFFDHNPEARFETGRCRDRLKNVLKRKRLNVSMRTALQRFVDFDGKDHWRRVELFRHMKTHRLEPKIQFQQVDPNRDWIYPSKITKAEALKQAKWDAISGYGAAYKGLPKNYKERESQRYLRLRKFGNSYYDQKAPISRLISYPDFQCLIDSCLKDIVVCAAAFFQLLPDSPGFRNVD